MSDPVDESPSGLDELEGQTLAAWPVDAFERLGAALASEDASIQRRALRLVPLLPDEGLGEQLLDIAASGKSDALAEAALVTLEQSLSSAHVAMSRRVRWVERIMRELRARYVAAATPEDRRRLLLLAAARCARRVEPAELSTATRAWLSSAVRAAWQSASGPWRGCALRAMALSDDFDELLVEALDETDEELLTTAFDAVAERGLSAASARAQQVIVDESRALAVRTAAYRALLLTAPLIALRIAEAQRERSDGFANFVRSLEADLVDAVLAAALPADTEP